MDLKEKKEYVAPQMTVTDMSMTSLLCQSAAVESLFNGFAADDDDDDLIAN